MRTLGLLAVATLVAAVAAGCGSGGGSNSAAPEVTNLTPLAYVKHATTTTATVPQHMTLKAQIDAGKQQQVTLDGSGEFDVRSHRGSMHLDLAAGAVNGSFDEVLAGTSVYLKSSLFPSSLLQGKSWLKLDAHKVGKAYGPFFSQDPARSLGQLKGLIAAKKVGTDQLDGVATTHFRGPLDVSKVPQAARLGLSNATFTPIDVWVGDDDGYIRRVKFGVAYLVPNTADADLTMQIDYSDFGKAVDVAVPPDSQVLDMTNRAMPGLGS